MGRGSCIGNRTEKGKLFTHLLKTEFHLIKHLDFFDFETVPFFLSIVLGVMDDLLIVKQMESTSQCKDENCCENRRMFELTGSVGYTFWFNHQAVKRPLDWGRRKERLRMCEMVTDCGYPTL